MPDVKSTPIPIDMRGWVMSVPAGVSRRQRQAIEIALNTVASCQEMAESCSLKGGILMGLKYGSPRLTADIDFSITGMPTPETPNEFQKALDALFSYIAVELGHVEIEMRVHSIKKLPKKKFGEASFPGLQLKMTYVDKRNEVQYSAYKKGRPIEIVDMDISFNEPAKNLSILRLSGEREMLAYGLVELLAEKFRSLHQQINRKRNRRQDVYDIWFLSTTIEISDEDLVGILSRLKEKSKSRGIDVTADTFNNPEIMHRAQADWDTQAVEIGDDLPDFEQCWAEAVALYAKLPWH